MSNLLQLERYELKTFSVKWHDMRSPEKGVELVPSFDFNIGTHKDDPRRYRLEFIFRCANAGRRKEAFEIDASIVGYFTCPEEWDNKVCPTRAALNGCNILYGVLRGLITTVTAQFPYGTYFLPTVNMQDVVLAVSKEKSSQVAHKTKNSVEKMTNPKKQSSARPAGNKVSKSKKLK